MTAKFGACHHQEYANGHCAEMSCWNYYMKGRTVITDEVFCAYCGESETFDDPFAHFIDINKEQIMAHDQCGRDHGLELA